MQEQKQPRESSGAHLRNLPVQWNKMLENNCAEREGPKASSEEMTCCLVFEKPT